MKVLSIYISLIIFSWGIVSCQDKVEHKKSVRQPVVAGSFYPGDAQSLNTQLHQFFQGVVDKSVNEDIAAIIVPHAGYVFSGPVAASAYAKINPEKSFSRIFLIGSSHHIYINGASIYNQGDYKTPLGTVKVDTKLADKLIKENRLVDYVPGAHTKEHSLEVQLPFLQYHLKKPFQIVPIVIGTQDAMTCKKLSEILKPYFTSDNLFVISSDFSHYPSYDDAVKNDKATGDAVMSNSPEKFLGTILANEKMNLPGLVTSCCGWSSILTLLYISSEQDDIKVQHIKYMNSGDSRYGDKERVVGYQAIVFTRGKKTLEKKEFQLSSEDKEILLKIARETIEKQLEHNSMQVINEDELPENIKTHCGAFVTLNKNHQLRGCIGRFMADEPLYKVVQQMALASAFQDTRFTPVSRDEINEIDIEISVLTPLKKIQSIDDFKLGEQGIYMIKGSRSGTFLPQVAESTGWNKEEFLGHCARDKAGIGWDGWKDADLYTYEALVFDERQLINLEK